MTKSRQFDEVIDTLTITNQDYFHRTHAKKKTKTKKSVSQRLVLEEVILDLLECVSL